MKKFKETFGDKKAILGMIHLSGGDGNIVVHRALKEIEIYQKCGLAGVIVENYHGSIWDIEETLRQTGKMKFDIKIGVNVLPNDLENALWYAEKWGDFIQLDHIAGTYEGRKKDETIEMDSYYCKRVRGMYPRPLVLGGVWPKYYNPIEGSSLEEDVLEGMRRSDALVITGEGTGKETPLDKLKQFRNIVGDNYPLIVGAGVDASNVQEQMEIADGAIIGSAFKPYKKTTEMVQEDRIMEIMNKL